MGVVARNRRMFGALVGTLQKFNKEEIKKKDVLEKKKVVEKNVEEKVEKEKEEIKNKKRELFYEQKKKKKDIQIIQIQMKRVEEYEIWEKSKQFEGNFIRTKADPDIYWLPKEHTEKTQELLDDTKGTVAKEIESRKEEFEEELLSIERKLSLDQDRSRNGGSGDIRERLGKVKSLDDSLEAGEEEEEEGGGFMSDRRVVERDRDNESNGADLRMTLKNDLAERIGKQKEEERRIRLEEDKRRDEKRRVETSQNGTAKTPAESPPGKAEPSAKRKQSARDQSSDSDEKSKRDSGSKRKRTKSGRSIRSSKKEKKSKHESSDSDSSSEEERPSKKRSSSSSSDSEEERSKKRKTRKERKRAKSSSSGRDTTRKNKKRSKKESSSEDSSS